MANYNDVAFETMKKAAKNKASDLFTESEYNAFASDEDRSGYDKEALLILKSMFSADSTKNEFKDINFNKYLDLLKPELFKERVLASDGDKRSRELFINIYEGDFDQFKASALKGVSGRGKDVPGSRGPSGKY